MRNRKPLNWPFLLGTTIIMVVVLQLSTCEGAWIFPSAGAGEADLQWTAPTKNCDGTSLTNLTGYDLTYGQKRVALPLTPLTTKVTGLVPGVWWFSLAAKTPTERSEFITVEKTVLPADFKVAAPDVYSLVKRVDRIVLTRVGTVPMTTVCNPAETVNGKYVVPRAAVTWSGTVKPDVVVATCQ